MGAAQVIIQSAAWNAIKQRIYKLGDPLEYGNTDMSDSQFSGFSLDGLEVVECVKFMRWIDGRTETMNINDCKITVQQQKNIIKTAIAGMNGTVKEYISDGDYQITLKGRISSNKPDVFPQEEVEKLGSFLRHSDILPVASEYLRTVFGIFNIVIDSYTFERKEGESSTQEYEIKCLSHQPIELILIDKK